MKNKILAMCLAFAVLLQSSVMLIGAAETEVKSVDAESDVVVMDSAEESTPDMPQEQEELELSETETDPIQSDIEVEIIEIPNENESFEEETTIEEDDANKESPVAEESTEISSEEPEEIPGEEEPVDTETESGEEITEEPNTNEQEEPEATETQDESLEESESSEVTDVDGELVQSNETEKLNINRSNVVDGDFFADIEIYIEHNSEATVGPIYGDDEIGLYNSGTNESLSVNDEVYDTAPAMISATSLHASASSPELNGIRFKATVTPEQKAAAIEYGFLFASTDALQNHNLDLSFGITEITYKSGVNYSVADGVDKYLSIDESGNYVFAIVAHSIPESAYVKGITARPYIIYNIDEVETIVYGNTFSNCLYRTAKDEVVSSDDEVVVEFAQSIIHTAENMSTCLDTAVEVHLDERIDRSIGINPDIDVITFTPEASSFYTLTFTSEEEASYEVLDESECELTKIEINNITNETAYLFEESQNYYIRVKGEPNTDYSIQATPCLANAIYYDFSNDTEGFTFGGGATGVAENGVLNLSINKSALTSKAYMQNTDLSIDLFDYNDVYDVLAAAITMVLEERTIYFEYDDKDWRIQLWKGDYTGVIGAEIGVYNKPLDRSIEHYTAAFGDDMLIMSLTVYYNDELLFTRYPQEGWWVNGFSINLDNVSPSELDVKATILFDNYESRTKFVDAYIKEYGSDTIVQSVEPIDNVVVIDF